MTLDLQQRLVDTKQARFFWDLPALHITLLYVGIQYTPSLVCGGRLRWGFPPRRKAKAILCTLICIIFYSFATPSAAQTWTVERYAKTEPHSMAASLGLTIAAERLFPCMWEIGTPSRRNEHMW